MNPDSVLFILFFLFRLKQLLFLIFLFAASLYDLKTKRIPNRLWVSLSFFLFPLLLFEFILIERFRLFYLFQFFLSVGAFFIFSIIVFSMKFFGGADCKAFLLIAIGFSGLNSIAIPIQILIYSLAISVLFISVLFLKNGFLFFKSEKTGMRFQTFIIQFLSRKIPFLPSITIGFCLFILNF